MIKARKLARDLQLRRRDNEEHKFWTMFTECLDSRQIQPLEISLRDVFEEFTEGGRELVDSWNPRHGGGGVMLSEAGSAVTTSDFSNITGQIVYNMVKGKFNDPVFISGALATTIPTRFDGEKIPGIGDIGDEIESIGENQEYPFAGVSEEYVETPSTTKRGVIVPVTKEAIFFDRTGLLLQRAGDVSFSMAINKEKRIIDMAIGAVDIYKRNGAAAAGTYVSTPYDNTVASNALVDWTDIENAEESFDALDDPNTGEPIAVVANTILVPSSLKRTAQRIVSVTGITFGPGGSLVGDVATSTVATSAQPTGSQYAVLSNQFVQRRMTKDNTANHTWWIGDPRGAFAYMENWPITVVRAPSSSHDEFHRDVVDQFKISERGASAVIEPRKMVQCSV